MATVAAIPNEILVDIFRHVQRFSSESRLQKRKRPWYQLLRVCKRWWAIARASPILWRVIDLDDQPDTTLLRYSLTYSGEMPVDISVGYLHQPFAPITSIVSPHAHRIRTLKLDCLMHTTEYALASLLYHPMPALEMLLISFWADGNDGDDELEPLIPDQQEDEEGEPIRYPFFWFPNLEQFPNIIDLTLGRTVAFSLHMPVLPTLKRLKLSYCTILGDIRFKEFLEYVRKYPLLEELSLCRVRIPLPHPEHRPLTLPLTLRKFSLEDFTPYMANFVWMLAPLPADLNIHLTRRIRYSGPDFEPETPLSATYCLQQDRSNLPILTLVESVIVRQTWCEVYNLIGRTPTGTTISLSGRIPEDLVEEYDFLGDLVNVFGSAPVKELRVEGHEQHMITTDHWTRALLAFSRLRRIAVTDTALDYLDDEPGLNACATLLEVLRGNPASSGAPLLCSELDSLELVATDPDKDAQFAKELSELLTFRASRNKPIKDLRILLRSPRDQDGDVNNVKRREIYTSLDSAVPLLHVHESPAWSARDDEI